MAKFEIDESSIEDYVSKLTALENSKGAGRVLYEGAKVVTDAIKQNIEKLPVTNKRGTKENPIDGVTLAQKRGLKDGLGIAKLRNENGVWNLKIGFTGYNTTISKTAKRAKWTTDKQANAMIARSVEGGTTFRKKHPFVAPAIRSSKQRALDAMKKQFEEETKKHGFE